MRKLGFLNVLETAAVLAAIPVAGVVGMAVGGFLAGFVNAALGVRSPVRGEAQLIGAGTAMLGMIGVAILLRRHYRRRNQRKDAEG